MRNFLKSRRSLPHLLLILAILLIAEVLKAQEIEITGDLLQRDAEVFNRRAEFAEDGVYLDKKEGDGFLKIKGIQFNNGTIEADIRGSNTPQESFVGIAFHGQDSLTYDVIYFRPFNFENTERKDHSAQYIAHPSYTWSKLRNEHPGKYEASIIESINPNGWFHVRLEISYPQVAVYVNNQEKATLRVQQLSERKGGWIGFWVGNFSDGHFKNLQIKAR